ncbi:hypothetical protein DFH09DRAFT_1094592 [Mycena vulgaris]|nr:hypothetical protein DFH09DRAFT_1094592 [Mycena vulgaris]
MSYVAQPRAKLTGCFGACGCGRRESNLSASAAERKLYQSTSCTPGSSQYLPGELTCEIPAISAGAAKQEQGRSMDGLAKWKWRRKMKVIMWIGMLGGRKKDKDTAQLSHALIPASWYLNPSAEIPLTAPGTDDPGRRKKVFDPPDLCGARESNPVRLLNDLQENLAFTAAPASLSGTGLRCIQHKINHRVEAMRPEGGVVHPAPNPVYTTDSTGLEDPRSTLARAMASITEFLLSVLCFHDHLRFRWNPCSHFTPGSKSVFHQIQGYPSRNAPIEGRLGGTADPDQRGLTARAGLYRAGNLPGAPQAGIIDRSSNLRGRGD